LTGVSLEGGGMTREMREWPADLGWVIEALGSVPDDITSMTLSGFTEMDRPSWQRLQALARSEGSFTYRTLVLTFAAQPFARERPPYHSDIRPPRFRVHLELNIRKD
jgi:hypothetical protein